METEDLEIEVVRARIGLFAAREGLRAAAAAGAGGPGLRMVLSRDDGTGDVFFAAMAPGASGVSLSLVLVVDEAFFRENAVRILEVASRYEVCVSLEEDDRLGEGEVYLTLSLRTFLPGLTEDVLGLVVRNLVAARDALARAFP